MKLQLLGIDSNPKTVKGQSFGYVTAILYLSPSDSSGEEFCPLAKIADCKTDCLTFAGRGGMAKGNATFETESGATLPDNAVQRARLRRSELFNNDRNAFMAQLVREIEWAQTYVMRLSVKLNKDLKLVVRLNGTSDIRWESIPADNCPNIFTRFSRTQFYDYTKIPNRRIAGIKNYHLTFSYSNAPEFAPIVIKALAHYGESVSFAVVFKGAMPEYFLGRAVINGDESDLRFLDRAGVVVGLKAKGRARTSLSQFAVRVAA
jgi:hypothetical protein